jgi:hypothetical protein
MLERFRVWLACRRLEKLIKARQASFEVQDYRKRRAAALKARAC